LEGLLDKWITQSSARKAPVDEVMALVDRYKNRYDGQMIGRGNDMGSEIISQVLRAGCQILRRS
jgi:hypothetical protein